MKKVFLMLAAVAAFTFVSCKDSKKTDAPAEGEKIEEQAQEGDVQDPEQLGEDLNKALESNDGEGLKGKIDAAKEWAQNLLSEGKGEQAKGILEKVQTFLSENADKVTSVVGDNEYVKKGLDWVKGLNAGELIDKAGEALGVKDAADATKDAAAGVAADAAGKAAGAVEAAKAAGAQVKEKAEQAVEAVKNTDVAKAAADKANEVKEQAKKAGEEAIDKAKQEVNKTAEDAVNKGIDAVKGLIK